MLLQNMKLVHQWQGGLHNRDMHTCSAMQSCSIIDYQETVVTVLSMQYSQLEIYSHYVQVNELM